jgi:cobaltochelatase CobS
MEIEKKTFLAKMSAKIGAYVEFIFTKAAQIIISRKLTKEYLDEEVKRNLEKSVDLEAKSIVPNVSRRLEDFLIDTSRDEIRKDVERRLQMQPLDAIIRNTIDDQLLPQIVPRLERAMRDAEQLIEDKMRRVLGPIIEDIIGRDSIEEMLRIEVAKVAQDYSKDAGKQKVKLHAVANPSRKFHHTQFPDVLKIVREHKGVAGSKILMVGPAGSGKTLIAEDVAEAMKLPFYFNGPVQSEFKLLGYKDGNGTYHYTPFRKAFEFGGVYLFDEFDACSAQAMVAFNTALSNEYCDFPDRTVQKSASFVCMAAANTYGRGGTLNYSGRERLDGATLDRFVVYDIKYDEVLENKLAGDPEWVSRVQQIRSIAQGSFPWLIISMRASIEGARLLKKNYPLPEVEEAVLWRGQLSKEQVLELTRRVR